MQTIANKTHQVINVQNIQTTHTALISKQTNMTREMKSILQWGFTSGQQSFKSLQTTNAGQGVKKKETSYTVGRNINWFSHYREQYGSSSKD